MEKLLKHQNARPPERATPPPGLSYGRILVKLSGEALVGGQGYGIDPAVLRHVAQEIQNVCALDIQCAVVIGGGNIFRGLSGSTQGMDRASADYMGMLATVMNALALQDALEAIGVHTRVLSAISMEEVCEPYIRRRAMRHLEKKRVVIFAGGTGNPYFTTDTAASLRAMEIQADILMKATKVDGVYDKDPAKHKDAKRYDTIRYMDVLAQGLKVMDTTAVSLCMDNEMPMCVFDMKEPGNIERAVKGERVGTLIVANTAEKGTS